MTRDTRRRATGSSSAEILEKFFIHLSNTYISASQRQFQYVQTTYLQSFSRSLCTIWIWAPMTSLQHAGSKSATAGSPISAHRPRGSELPSKYSRSLLLYLITLTYQVLGNTRIRSRATALSTSSSSRCANDPSIRLE